MKISDQIRQALQQCGEPMTVEQMSDANGWERPERNQAYTLLGQMKKRGEIEMSLAEGKAHYALVDGYQSKRGRPHGAAKPGAGKRDRVSASPAIVSPEAAESLLSSAAVHRPGALFGTAYKGGDDGDRAPESRGEDPAPNHDELQQWSMQRSIERGSSSKALVVSDFDLQRRLDAIATDAEDALEDALKVGLKTEFLQQLHQASVAINRAARAYARN